MEEIIVKQIIDKVSDKNNKLKSLKLKVKNETLDDVYSLHRANGYIQEMLLIKNDIEVIQSMLFDVLGTFKTNK